MTKERKVQIIEPGGGKHMMISFITLTFLDKRYFIYLHC